MVRIFKLAFAVVLVGLPAAAQAPSIDEVRRACAGDQPVAPCAELTDALIASDPAPADLAAAYGARGMRYHRERALRAEALADYAVALKIEPNATTYFNRAQLLRFCGDEAASLADLEQAVALRPDYGKAWVDMSLILGNQGDYPAAIKAAENALERDSELSARFQSMAWTNIGDANLRLGDVLGAKSALLSAVAMDPQNAGAHRHLVRAYVQLKDKARATAALEVAEAADPYSPFNTDLAAQIDAID